MKNRCWVCISRLVMVLMLIGFAATSHALAAVGTGEGELRPPAVPLVVHDPFFSAWLMGDQFHSQWAEHWNQTSLGMTGNLRIDGGDPFRFMGKGPDIKPMTQTDMEMTATRSIFTFEHRGVELILTFTNPLLLDDLELLGRPVTYVHFAVRAIDGNEHDVQLYFDATAEWAVNDVEQEVYWERRRPTDAPVHAVSDVMVLGAANQNILGAKGDKRRIEWGHMCVLPAVLDEASDPTLVQTHLGRVSHARHYFKFNKKFPVRDNPYRPKRCSADWPLAGVAFDLGKVGSATQERLVLLGYDDIFSVEYFERWLRPWWNRSGVERIEDVMADALREYPEVKARCEAFDKAMLAKAQEIGGDKYADLCVLAYRQAIAAHKLVADVDGQTPLFISKENHSNGSMGTVDVTHPSIPLFLYYNPQIVRGMLEYIYYYCEEAGWENPWAPHDIGKYPIGNGVSYKRQMEYEESGNMILMTYALVLREKNPDYARRHWETLSKWAGYLKDKGWNPDNQLSTDDFGGRIEHNCNLSIKATLALAAYGKMAAMLDKEGIAAEYLQTAAAWKDIFEKEALDAAGDHYKLRFDQDGTWSQKYNLVWDKVLGLNLYSPIVAQREVAFYRKIQNRYGLPLDCRNDYSKTDWIMWSACLAEKDKDFQALIAPLWDFYNETPDRVPMTDWTWTKEPKRRGFQARSVVGGMFMKHLVEERMTGGEEVMVYPHPGSLGQVEGLEESSVFDLKVNGRDTFVYRGFEKDQGRYSEKGLSYCSFAFENTQVTLEIQATQAMKAWDIKPVVGKAIQLNDKTVRLNLSQHKKFLFTATLADDQEQYFIISAEWPELRPPQPGDTGVRYLDTGVHSYGKSWDPFADGKTHTLYLAAGAVLEATILTRHHDNIAIRGRGLIAQAFVEHGKKAAGKRGWYAEWMGTFINACREVTVEGVSIISSPSFQLELCDCDSVEVFNVKLLGFGEHNNDGLHAYSRNMRVEDCFIVGNDDRICVTGLYDSCNTELGMDERLTDCVVENNVFRDITFWGLRNGGDIMLTWNGGQRCENILLENCESLARTNRGFITAQHGGAVPIRNIHIRNCHLWHGQLVDWFVTKPACWGKGGGSVRDVYIENVTLAVEPNEVGRRLSAKDEVSNIDNLMFNNIQAHGQLLSDVNDAGFEIRKHVGRISFNQPHVFLTEPYTGAHVRVKSNKPLGAKPLGFVSVDKVEFYANDQKVGEDDSAPYGIQWRPTELGDFVLKAVAMGDGKQATSSTVAVTVSAH